MCKHLVDSVADSKVVLIYVRSYKNIEILQANKYTYYSLEMVWFTKQWITRMYFLISMVHLIVLVLFH